MARRRRQRQQSVRTPAPSSPEAPGRRRGRLLLALAVATLLVGAGILWSTRQPEIRREPGLNVLLITVDTLRADALGAYGHPGGPSTTPWIDRLAEGGVRFEHAYAHNVVTLPSHANILSSLLPVQHGVRDNTGFRFPSDLPTLATILQEKGWRTGAFVSAFVLDSRFGLDRGFEVYDDRLGGQETSTAFQVPERAGPKTVAAARRWLESVRGERWFAFVHLYEPHFPYRPDEPFASRFPSDPYAGEVASADAALAPLLEPLLEAGAAERTFIVLTSDHGESLGEHGEATHGIFAYEGTLHVPLIFRAPGVFASRIVREPVRHIDVVPTILDALAIEAPSELAGRSLLSLIAGRQDEAPETLDSYFESLSPSLNRGWAPLRGVVVGRLKYVDLPLPELYDLAADPGERTNLVTSRPRDVARLQGQLRRLRTGDVGVGGRVEEEQATLERLRALGYVAGGAPQKEHYSEEDDPKRLVVLDTWARDVATLYLAGDLDGAVALCEKIIARRPDMALSHLQLAHLERERGRLDAAARAARRAVELNPRDPDAVSLYAVYLTEGGRAREAVAFLAPYAEAEEADIDVLTALGMAQARVGQSDEALATFARVRAVDPTNAMALVNLGTVYLMQGDGTRARQAFEAALEIDDGVARAHNSLGVIAAREGRTAEAIARWQRAVALDPRDYQTLFNLGTTLREQGREGEAREYLKAYLRVAPVALEGRDMARVRAWLDGADGS